MTNSEIDKLILSHCTYNWQKSALVLYKAIGSIGLLEKAYSSSLLTKRLKSLQFHNKIETRGNLYNWRGSEIRLPIVRGG